MITQKGYPTGVIVDVELFTALRQLVDLHLANGEPAGDEEPAGEETPDDLES